jgi:uncharacterized protein with ParB-like and HNH nuclease domain
MAVGITSQTLSLGAALNDFYIVPDYQRGFVWERREVQKLLEDIYREFTSRGSEGEYFIGPSVVCPAPNGAFEITDGQQRLTSIYLTLCAIRSHLNKIGAKPIMALEQKLAAHDVDAEGRDLYRYRLILGYADSAALLQSITTNGASVDHIQATTGSIENLITAFKTARTFIEEQFGDQEDRLKSFYAFLTKNVKTARIETAARSQALRVFETVNHRGVVLGPMDLLKNLVVMYTPESHLEELKVKWKDLVDALYISSKMAKAYQRERQYRFLLYFIRTNFKVMDMPEDMLYDWFWRNPQCGYKDTPIQFVNDLLDSAKTSYYRGGGGG